MLIQSFTERLRPLVWMKGWDYIVLWKLSDDHRSIELMDCCCGGTENMDELNFEASSSSSSCTSNMPLPCRDVMFPHPRVKSCDLLDLIPSSMVLDTGVHAQTLCSNQPSWLNYSHTSDSTLSQEGFGTRVLIPVSVGLVELYVTKQVPEDEEVIDLIKIQYNIYLEQQSMSNAGATVSFSSAQKDQICSIFQQQQQQQISKDLPHDISADRIHLSTPSPHNSSGMFLEGGGVGVGGYESSLFSPSMENAFQEVSNASRENRWMDDQMHHDQDSFVCNRSDESEPNEDEDDPRSRRSRNGKGPPQSKNLDAERKRRKKLNDRLYALRALVPNISKLDRASILGDAIEYVKELQKQADDLKLELEQHSDDEDSARKTSEDGNDKSVPTSIVHPNGTKRGPKREQENFGNGSHRGPSCNNNHNMSCKQNQEIDFRNEKVQQMEPQVEVYQVDANEFFVKVFCEHKFGGFVRLLEALNALGLEVSNVNTTRHTCLASSIFKVERKNDEIVEAEDVKESLLELTRNPTGMWAGADNSELIITTNTIDNMDNNINNNNHNHNNNNNSNDYDHHYTLHHDHASYQINSHHHQH